MPSSGKAPRSASMPACWGASSPRSSAATSALVPATARARPARSPSRTCGSSARAPCRRRRGSRPRAGRGARSRSVEVDADHLERIVEAPVGLHALEARADRERCVDLGPEAMRRGEVEAELASGRPSRPGPSSPRPRRAEALGPRAHLGARALGAAAGEDHRPRGIVQQLGRAVEGLRGQHGSPRAAAPRRPASTQASRAITSMASERDRARPAGAVSRSLGHRRPASSAPRCAPPIGSGAA